MSNIAGVRRQAIFLLYRILSSSVFTGSSDETEVPAHRIDGFDGFDCTRDLLRGGSWPRENVLSFVTRTGYPFKIRWGLFCANHQHHMGAEQSKLRTGTDPLPQAKTRYLRPVIAVSTAHDTEYSKPTFRQLWCSSLLQQLQGGKISSNMPVEHLAQFHVPSRIEVVTERE